MASKTTAPVDASVDEDVKEMLEDLDEKPSSAEILAEAIARATVKATREAEAEYRVFEIRTPPKRSVLNPTGGPRPKLKCPVVFCGAPQYENSLTNEEIELFNKLHAGRYEKGRWHVIVRDDGMGETQEHLEVRIPVSSIDDRMALPGSLVDILKKIINEYEARAAKKPAA